MPLELPLAATRSSQVRALISEPDTYYDDARLAEKGIDMAPYLEMLERFAESGQLLMSATESA